ncbi:MAG: DNA primase [Candidatus Omnitrophota bacterium]|nr:DNA primase [Candidatus Omnitrophota bacterium]
MPIPEKTIEEIQQKSDIIEVISQYILLKKIGRNYKAPCPFHHEKTPSFIVSPDKQIYHCFGCGAGGNVFSFVMKYENLQFPEAVAALAHKAGVAIPRIAGQGGDPANSSLNQFYKINEAASQFFQTCLANNAASRDYLALRGVGDAVIKKFRLGYAPDSWEGLLNFFKTKGVSSALLEKAGLAVSNEKGGHYDRFRNRIIFPIMDLKDRILGFGARVLDSSLPKYINSPETPIYSKGKNLYGLNLSKEDIRKTGHALVVEGYLDFLIPYQVGVKNIIATLGTALTTDQVKILKRFANTVVIVYDPDEAGESASLRGLDLFISEDVNVYIAELPSGFDPDGYIRKFGAEDFTRLVKSSKNLFDYKFDKLCRRFDANSTHGKAGIVGEMLPTIARIDNAVSRSELMKKLAEKLSVDEESVRTELKKVKLGRGERPYIIGPVEIKKDYKSAEMIILALLLGGENYISSISRHLSLSEFKNSSIRDAVGIIFNMLRENKEINPAKLINYLGGNSEAAMLISEAVNILEALADKDRAMSDCINRIRKDNIKDQLGRLQEAIRAAHGQKDEDLVKKLVGEYSDLVKVKPLSGEAPSSLPNMVPRHGQGTT